MLGLTGSNAVLGFNVPPGERVCSPWALPPPFARCRLLPEEGPMWSARILLGARCPHSRVWPPSLQLWSNQKLPSTSSVLWTGSLLTANDHPPFQPPSLRDASFCTPWGGMGASSPAVPAPRPALRPGGNQARPQ